jgi:hypothetical protein
MRMIRILVLYFLVVCIVIYRISLIIKNRPGSMNCIILLLRLKEKYMDDDNSRNLGLTVEDLFRSVPTSTSPRHMLLSLQQLLQLLSREVMCLLCNLNRRRRFERYLGPLVGFGGI